MFRTCPPAVAVASALILTACSSEAPPTAVATRSEVREIPGSDDGTATQAPPAPEPTPVAQPTRCRWENQTFSCECRGGLSGRQVCMGGVRTDCECAPPVEPYEPPPAQDALEGNNRSDIEFDWKQTAFDTGTCEPGDYQGGFAGSYFSRINWPAPFPVIGTDAPGAPGMKFVMLPAEPGEVVLKVDGNFDGLASGLFPFFGDFVGELNCETGEASAMMLNGEYSIGPDQLVIVANPIRFNFEGPVWATYDKLTHSFVGGIWDAVEPQFGGKPFESYPRDPLRDGVGGSGVWSASWVGGMVDYECPATDPNGVPLACQPGPFGLTKTFCVYPNILAGVTRADAPGCQTDADCEAIFPGEDVECVDINADGAFVRCLKECSAP